MNLGAPRRRGVAPIQLSLPPIHPAVPGTQTCIVVQARGSAYIQSIHRGLSPRLSIYPI
eukprot:COSAG06_NODE_44164_length_365_cov_2.398496_1_plen_58_part_01